jgi:O-antigen ligase
VLDKAIAAGLLIALVFTTLAHGAVEPWSIAVFELILIVLMLLWGIKAIVDRGLRIMIPAAVFPMVALLVLGMVQSAAFSDRTGQWSSLSMDVEATRDVVTVLFFLIVAFIMAANFFVTRERLFLLANVLTVFGAVLAAFTLVQHFTWDRRFYWLRSTSEMAFGPFVNHNHFAGYMELLIPVPLALIVTVVGGQLRLIYGFAAALMGTATIISGSRGGMLSLAAALALIAALSRRFTTRTAMDAGAVSAGRRIWHRFGPITVIALTIIIGVVWIGATPVFERIGLTVDELVRSGTPDVSRASMWRDTITMIRNHPLVGVGLGAYETVYPAYAASMNHAEVDYAHNDYLQILSDGGVVGGIIALWFLVLIFRAISRGAKSHDPLLAGLALASAAGIFAILVHSLSDSNLQIPSHALLFLVLSAVASRIGAMDPQQWRL